MQHVFVEVSEQERTEAPGAQDDCAMAKERRGVRTAVALVMDGILEEVDEMSRL